MAPMNYDVIVVGAGASGMMAAARAAEKGAKVLLLEKMRRAGLKLLISGKGRSNITNAQVDIAWFISHYSRTGSFLINAFHKFFNKDLIELFSRFGIEIIVERGKRVFPKSQRSSTIVDGLMKYLRKNHVHILYGKRVKEILTEDGKVKGVVTSDGDAYSASKVILATGGLSYPRTGSTGDGYEIAKSLGHTIIVPKPALVPLETKEGFVKDLMGLSLENVKASVHFSGKKIAEEFGDMLFTHFGISGPIILKLSGEIVDLLEKGEVTVSIDLKPALALDKLDKRLQRELLIGKRQFNTILRELLPRKLIPVFIRLSGIPEDKKASQITQEERKRVTTLLKDFRVTITKARPIEEAIVTRGGVSTKEIDPKTMESKLVGGLYFCGEIIDVDGETGGYNLQAAFSTGYVAGESAAKMY